MIDSLTYARWPNCLRLHNERLELVASTGFGPRILHFGRPGGPNQFGLLDSDHDAVGAWRIYGGHRLARSPEVPGLTYLPEDSPLEAQADGDRLQLRTQVEPQTGLRKSLDIQLGPDFAEVTHRLSNESARPMHLAPWALTVMAPGGLALVPAPTASAPDGLLPDRSIILWPYTRLDDPRVRWGGRYITVQHDPARSPRFKFGLTASDGWLGHWRDGSLFVKSFTPLSGEIYPDFGAVLECFADGQILELETLGPLVTLAPGEAAVHVERWHLFDNLALDSTSDESIAAALAPLAAQFYK